MEVILVTCGITLYDLTMQACHNFVGVSVFFSGKIRINPYHSNIPHAKHRNNARNTVLLFIAGTHK